MEAQAVGRQYAGLVYALLDRHKNSGLGAKDAPYEILDSVGISEPDLGSG